MSSPAATTAGNASRGTAEQVTEVEELSRTRRAGLLGREGGPAPRTIHWQPSHDGLAASTPWASSKCKTDSSSAFLGSAFRFGFLTLRVHWLFFVDRVRFHPKHLWENIQRVQRLFFLESSAALCADNFWVGPNKKGWQGQ